MVFLGRLHILGDTPAEEIAIAFRSESGEGVKGGRLLLGRGRRQEGLGVRREILAAVRGIETFGEDDEGGARFGGFEDARAGPSEVGGLVGAW